MQQLVDNRYRIVRPLGSGGMAEVYLAHDDILDRDVALKVMSGRYAEDEEFIERFKREAQSAAALSHPNIVSIYDRGESEDGTYYIAMEYLPGGTLKDRILKKGKIAPRTAAAVALQIAEALQAAHKNGVVHRDIKPHNILITGSGDLKVTDFGIARAASSSTMTKTGSILGTAHYISPEQAMGEPVGPASDLYSLGIVLYEMLTGTLPFDADTPIGIAMKHVNGHLRPPGELDPSIPQGINAVTVRLLAKDPLDRYANAAELIEDLQRVMGGLAPAAATTQLMSTRAIRDGATTEWTRVAPAPMPARGRKDRSFAPLLIALLALAVLAPAAWAGYNFLNGLTGKNDPPPEPELVQVPTLLGMPLEEAQRKVEKDFKIVEEERRDGNRPEGVILAQDPSGGEAKKGSRIEVAVSSGENDIPDVRGSTREEAESMLRDAGFKVNAGERKSELADEGLVIEQDPSDGVTVEIDTEVDIVIGTGPDTVKVPDIPYGYTAEESRVMLEEAGLKLGNVTEAPNSDVPEGGIIDQNPRPDEEVEEGSTVDIVLSSGPEQVTVPDVVGMKVDAARTAIRRAGLGYHSKEVQSRRPAGTVISTDPVGGALADVGTYVTITYSSGPPERKPQPRPETPPKEEAEGD